MENNDNLASTIYSTLGINIVTCGDCGAVNLHKAGLEEITCEYCNNTSDICNFPDLFDVSLPSSEIVNEMKKFIINVPHTKYGYSFAVITNLEEDEVIDEALKKELFDLPEDAEYANIEEFDEEFDNEMWEDYLIKL